MAAAASSGSAEQPQVQVHIVADKVVPASPPAPEPSTDAAALAAILRPAEMVQPPQEGRVKFYKQESGEAKNRSPRTSAQWIARISWSAALLGLTAVATARPVRALSPALASMQHFLAAILVATALLSAAAVLTATWSSKRHGVLGPAMLGLCLSGAAVGLSIGLHFTNPEARGAVAPKTETATATPPHRPSGVAAPSVTVSLSEAARAGRDAMDRLPGWFGAATSGPAVIRIGEFPAAAPLLEELRANFVARPVLVLIAINNGKGHKALTVDPSSLRAEFPDGRRVSALAAKEVIATSLMDAEDGEGDSSMRLVRANPGEATALALAFLPEGTDLHDASRLTLVMNGKRVALSGGYLSAQQKADLVQRAATMASR